MLSEPPPRGLEREASALEPEGREQYIKSLGEYY